MFPQIIQELQDFFEYNVFYSVSTCNPATPSNSAYRINSSTRNTTTTRLIPCHRVQITTRHLPVTASVHPSILSGSQHRIHATPTTHSRNTGQDNLLRQFVPGQHRAGLSKIIHLKTYQQDIWCFRTISPRTGIITQLVPRHINKIYGVPRQQDNRSQDRNHYIRKGLSIVYPCNTKVSVFQSTTRISILSRVLVILCEDTVHYLQSKLS